MEETMVSKLIFEGIIVCAAVIAGTVVLTRLLDRVNVKINSRWLSTLSKFFEHMVAIKDPFSLPKVSTSSRNHLVSLPRREGPRPTTAGVQDHRQTSQLPTNDKQVTSSLKDSMLELAETHSEHVYIGHSFFTNGGVALFGRQKNYPNTKYQGEILSHHPAAGFLHVNLHPEDLKIVMGQGWGQRHPLSRDCASWLSAPWHTARSPPGCYAMIYAPRNASELETVEKITNAAVSWVTGVDGRENDQSWS